MVKSTNKTGVIRIPSTSPIKHDEKLLVNNSEIFVAISATLITVAMVWPSMSRLPWRLQRPHEPVLIEGTSSRWEVAAR